MTDPGNDISKQFLSDSRAFLTEQYLPSIEGCVARLTDEQIWSRSNEASNSIGNLILHLAGSTRYWASDVIGQEPTGRVRQQEFDQRGPLPSPELLTKLRASVTEAERRLAGLTADELLEIRKTKEQSLTVLWCVYHIVEHFAMHTGQIASMTKALIGEIEPSR